MGAQDGGTLPAAHGKQGAVAPGGNPPRSRWSRFVESAVRGEAEQQPGRVAGQAPVRTGDPSPSVVPGVHPRAARQRFWRWCTEYVRTRAAAAAGAPAVTGTGTVVSRRRTDLRLVLPACLVWGGAIAGIWLPPVLLALLCAGLAAAAAVVISRAAGLGRGGRAAGNAPSTARSEPRRRSFSAAAGASLMLAAAAAAHSAAGSTQRFDGPVAEAAAAGDSVVAVAEVTGSPRPVSGHGGAGERWSVPITTLEVSTNGVRLRTRVPLVVMGGREWGSVVPGQTLRAAGKLRPADPGRTEAGSLAAATAPRPATEGPALQGGAKELRTRFVSAASFLEPDARGLLPGMVTGDTSALDQGLGNAMKTVGMTHLTAVSGANCSLVLGALLLVCRLFRLPRVPAAAVALGGLALFVVLVGPDPSVLRAALMGAIGVATLAGGRSGRGLSFLCLAVIGLLLADPALGTSFGFLLSVLATLGIILLGRPIMAWMPAVVPRWVAASIAVPLSAQLLCGPVIVLLQPQFATYALLANVAASPLVAPVTLLGTAAVPLVAVLPWAATVLIAVAGAFSSAVAATARFAAQLPGSALPWPEGVPGLLSMLLLSLLTFAFVWAAARRRHLLRWIQEAHRLAEALIQLLESRIHRLRHVQSLKRWRGGPGCGGKCNESNS
ncbi:ComEC/Rec2 family competence protein [Pseudarthrobacter sp. efr-133-R2A-89]|uniref:ComEC/Rec2 family competence protein n=1 Tax=Pseudarthrobacter sp. efr-133-R2A-89 TaxID=3040302 RepID=UPI00255276C8|nr:ComEC/Rec2 family competence protein [Pseudarthrobacter sp. efr-133-R2A-89]